MGSNNELLTAEPGVSGGGSEFTRLISGTERIPGTTGSGERVRSSTVVVSFQAPIGLSGDRARSPWLTMAKKPRSGLLSLL